MKQIFMICLAVVIACSLSTVVSAKDELKVRGAVTKIENATKSITIQPRDGGAVTIVMNDAAMLSKVKEGDEAEVKYVVRNGVNAGSRVRKLIEGCN